MKKINESFYEEFKWIANSNIKNKINLFIKNNAWIIPLIYIIGTIALLIRNKLYGLPFYPISLIQFAVIVVLSLFFLFLFTIVEYNGINSLNCFKQVSNKEKGKLLQFIGYLIADITFLFIISLILWFIVEDMKRAIILCFGYYMVFPIMIITLNSRYKMSNLITIMTYISLILEVPISMGGFKGQEVLFHNNKLNSEIQYAYYGTYNGLYQFMDNENIYLIPIEDGYITYPKKNI